MYESRPSSTRDELPHEASQVLDGSGNLPAKPFLSVSRIARQDVGQGVDPGRQISIPTDTSYALGCSAREIGLPIAHNHGNLDRHGLLGICEMTELGLNLCSFEARC